jgi:sec-independent protein translocase protein TatA
MGIENPVHLIFVAAVALIVLGPKRLPELAKALGHGIREFREAISQEGGAPAQEPNSQHPPEPPAPAQHPPEPQGEAPVDPAGTLRSGDAPDRRPL